MATIKAKTVEEYIQLAPDESREKLKELRAILKEVVPEASEDLKW